MINKFNGAFAVTRAPSGNNTTVIMRCAPGAAAGLPAYAPSLRGHACACLCAARALQRRRPSCCRPRLTAATVSPAGRSWWAWQQTGQYHKEGGWARADPGHTSSGGNGYVVQSIECRSGHVAWAFGWVTWNVRAAPGLPFLAACTALRTCLPAWLRLQHPLARPPPRLRCRPPLQGSLTNANGIAEQRVWRSRLEGTW